MGLTVAGYMFFSGLAITSAGLVMTFGYGPGVISAGVVIVIGSLIYSA